MFLVQRDGEERLAAHPGWRIGATPETARPLTDDELVDAGYGLLVVDNPPDFDPLTQKRTLRPIAEWPRTARTAEKLYTVEQLPPIDYSQLDQEMLNAALAEQGSVVRALAEVVFDEINVLRQRATLAQRTKAQFLTALKNKMRD